MSEIAELGIKIDSDDIKSATKELDRLEDSSGDAEKATNELTDSQKKLGVAVKATYAIIATAVAASITKSIMLHAEFAASISELSAITGATGKDLQFYSQQAKLIGETTTLSATQAAQAFKLMASAKPDLLESGEALAQVTKEAVTLAEASGQTLPEAAVALGGSLNQFGADADQASRFINVLAAGAKFGASEINETAMALKVSGTVARNAGLSFEETNAAIQAMASVSIKGAEAGTGLRNIILKLSTQARDEFNPEIVGLSKALENLSGAELSTAEKSKLFGLESIAAANALLDQSDAIAGLTDKLTGTDTAYEQASIRNDNLSGDVKKMSSAWEAAGIELGESFDPALRATTQLITDIAKVVKTLILEFKNLGDAIGAFAAATVAFFKGDKAGRQAIIDSRREETDEIHKAIAATWGAVEAQTALNKTKKDDIETATKKEAVATTEWIGSEENVQLEIKASWIQENQEAELQRAKDHEASLLEASKQGATDRANIAKASIGLTSNLLSALSMATDTSNKSGFESNKKLQMAQTVINTSTAVMRAYSDLGPIAGPTAAVGLAALGAAQLSKIQSTQFGGGGGGISSAGSLPTGGNAPNPEQPTNVRGNGQQAGNIQITVQGSVVGENLEEIVSQALVRADKQDLFSVRVEGKRAQVA